MLKNISSAFRRRLLPFRKSESGVTAVEAAFIFPFFFGIVGIIAETGAMMFVEYAIQGGVQSTARLVRTGQAQQANVSAATFKAEICEFASIITNCASKLKVHVNADLSFGVLQSSAPDFDTLDTNEAFDCGGPQEYVAVIATYDHQFTMPWMQFFENSPINNARRLSGYAMFRNEPFPSTSGTC